ncbi:bifunctional DNA-formamidopyrimidine glycosylase/DNA-(apurinic or apyrimidinic site) lyase [Asticcacaulis sp. ZE23SCel15]|uniref:bifunctional DNA-formamidopyrimidine glycosylase/DNA-(apurinic or apyrimidinic site) lyase n=1 Tax=Asticcacaulis sp. ZE23SCel15 TaxID=3059027 RepID=UPI00265F05B8|nr:bifunctional DNA-formamidopyrimidine glycosylase/DNA-(apurinic or apyrimidinic site) lyase [Asticcacaulis sp. ZE23SCel15]WKL58210.1 bifunctional DNA-formamidopyrimidine glycosylase/DNA-(apurinic or apyrimidinic site) lyase [Asticcacaulis sp. ZE23SCel15]
MPELPEVETVKRGLAPSLEGAVLSNVRLNRPNLRYPFPDRFAERVNGATVTRLERRAKYLLAYMDTEDIWVTHLGMTGRFQVTPLGGNAAKALDGNYYHSVDTNTKHLHMSVVATKGNQTHLIDYYDPRRFGFMLLLTPDELSASKWFQGLGVEPLDAALNADFLTAQFAGRAANLKTLLMAQGLIAGLGNIYVCEALYRARLSPDMAGSDLAHDGAERLSAAIKSVITEAIAAGGSSISDFAATSGELGYFQHRFKVYDRKGQPCLTQGCAGVIERKVHTGRSTFFCSICQK